MSKNTSRKETAAEKNPENPPPRDHGNDALPYTRSQTVGYISDIVRELQLMAQRAELPFLAYLLELTLEEAESQKRKSL